MSYLNEWLPDAQIEAVEIGWSGRRSAPKQRWAMRYTCRGLTGISTRCVLSPAYGNRMADGGCATRGEIGRGSIGISRTRKSSTGPLNPDNGGAMQWGDKYKAFPRRGLD